MRCRNCHKLILAFDLCARCAKEEELNTLMFERMHAAATGWLDEAREINEERRLSVPTILRRRRSEPI